MIYISLCNERGDEMGLPRNKKQKAKRLSLVLPHDTYQDLKHLAEQRMLTISDIIRQSVIFYVQNTKTTSGQFIQKA